jgi:hypothetical protein
MASGRGERAFSFLHPPGRNDNSERGTTREQTIAPLSLDPCTEFHTGGSGISYHQRKHDLPSLLRECISHVLLCVLHHDIFGKSIQRQGVLNSRDDALQSLIFDLPIFRSRCNVRTFSACESSRSSPGIEARRERDPLVGFLIPPGNPHHNEKPRFCLRAIFAIRDKSTSHIGNIQPIYPFFLFAF